MSWRSFSAVTRTSHRRHDFTHKVSICLRELLKHCSNLFINFNLNSNILLQSCLIDETRGLTRSKISKSRDLFCNEAQFVLSGNIKVIEKFYRKSLYNPHLNFAEIFGTLSFGFQGLPCHYFAFCLQNRPSVNSILWNLGTANLEFLARRAPNNRSVANYFIQIFHHSFSCCILIGLWDSPMCFTKFISTLKNDENGTHIIIAFKMVLQMDWLKFFCE